MSTNINDKNTATSMNRSRLFSDSLGVEENARVAEKQLQKEEILMIQSSHEHVHNTTIVILIWISIIIGYTFTNIKTNYVEKSFTWQFTIFSIFCSVLKSECRFLSKKIDAIRIRRYKNCIIKGIESNCLCHVSFCGLHIEYG